MLTLNTGSPIQNPATIAAMAKKTAVENPIPYVANQSRTGEITRREFPITGLQFRLKITTSGAAGSEVNVNAGGLLPLIKKLRVAVDGTDHRFSVSGRHLRLIDWMYGKSKPRDTFVANVAHTYYAYFYLPFDIGGYFSPLYAAGNTSLDVQVDWADRDAIISGGTAAIDSAELQVSVDYVTGGAPGTRGGKDGPYAKLFIKSATIDIDATKSDKLLERLTNERGYHGLTLFTLDETGAPADDIVNSVELQRTDSQHLKRDWQDIRAENHRAAGSGDWLGSDPFTGMLHVPFVDPGHIEHVLSVKSDQSMNLYADVTKPGGGNGSVELVSHFLMT